MTVLQVQNLTKFVNGVDLIFGDVSFHLNAGEKMALVGRNGAGKTTLLRAVLGKLEADGGTVRFANGATVGYLSQDPELNPEHNLEEEAATAIAHMRALEVELRNLESQMADPGIHADAAALEALMERYASLTARFESAGGYDAHARVRSVLFGLGFKPEDLSRPVPLLSGGQKVRLGLTKLLLQQPDVLLLDEPTNHLDLNAVEWLEGYFKNLRSAAILVSHDRYFLDRVIGRVLELEDQKATLYHGNYTQYQETKEKNLQAQWDEWQRQQKEIQRVQAMIDKNIGKPSKVSFAHSKEKYLERMEKIDKPKAGQKSMKLRFDMRHESGNEVLILQNIGKAFGEKVLFSGLDQMAWKGERIALVGPNGAGKTTFLKLIDGRLNPTSGEYRWGVGVVRAFFDQDLSGLHDHLTAMGEIMELPGMTKYEAHSLLGRFLFSGEDAEKPVAILSGGERNRLILAKMMRSGANVLLLDEPTNHLDLDSKQVLEEALLDYPGTVFLVSHDRFFLDRVATQVWEFANGKVTVFEGNYSAYRAELARRQLLAEEAVAGAKTAQQAAEVRTGEPVKLDNQAQRAEKKAQDRAERQRQATLAKLEAEILRLEERKEELSQKLADPDIYKEESGRTLVMEYKVVEDDLAQAYADWERLME